MTGKRPMPDTVRKQSTVLESFVFFVEENLYQAAENRVIHGFACLELGNDKSRLLANSIQGVLLQEDDTEACIISQIERFRLIEFADGDGASRNCPRLQSSRTTPTCREIRLTPSLR